MAINCPKCLNGSLHERLGPSGVLVDICPTCSGVWLDKGEIYHYVKDKHKLHSLFAPAYKAPSSTSRYLCRRCDAQMYEVTIPPGVVMDVCGKCGGTWFDAGEVKTLSGMVDVPVVAAAPAPSSSRPVPVEGAVAMGAPAGHGGARVAANLVSLPSLGLRSVAVLGFLYGVFVLVAAAGSILYGLPLKHVFTAASLGLALSFLINPFLLDLSLRWMHSLRWVSAAELPPHLRAFVTKACAEKRLPLPSFGIIEDGTPNAFTYGHYPGNARLVLTRGLMNVLNEQELEAVVGHELGHIAHYDMLIMAVAALVPLLLKQIYEACRKMHKNRPRASSRRGKKGGDPTILIMVVSLVLYWITRYIVLFLSRTRELHADRFAGELTRKPNDLSSALVKIAYGLAGATKDEQVKSSAEAVGPLGVFDQGGAMAVAATAATPAGAAEAMGWDLFNPWAAYFELHSSHPLPAKRIEHLNRQSEAYGQPRYCKPPEKPHESLWDDFALDLLIMYLPWLLAAAALAVDPKAPWHAAVGWGLGQLIKLRFSYPSDFYPESTAAAMLKNLKVSGVRGVPVTLTGRVIGRGDPGYVFSEDFAVRDETGYLLVDYAQPGRIFQLIFALTSVRDLIGQPVVVRGWYRRAPVPYLELSSYSSPAGSGRCWSVAAQYVAAVLAVAAGLFMQYGGLEMLQ